MEVFIGSVVGAVVVGLIIFAIASWPSTESALSHARERASQICGSSGAVSFDVQGQNELVYACNSNHILRTMGY